MVYSLVQGFARYRREEEGTTDTEMLTAEDVAERMGVSVYTVWRWVKSGQLRAYKPGKQYRIRQSDLEEFLRAREVRPKAPGRSPFEPSFNDVLAAERREGAGVPMPEPSGEHIHVQIRDDLSTEPARVTVTRRDFLSVLRRVREGELTPEAAIDELQRSA